MKRIAKFSILSLLVIFFIGCGKNLESCVKTEFKKYASEKMKGSELLSIEPKDTIYTDSLINLGYSALSVDSKVSKATNNLMKWMDDGYSSIKMEHSEFMRKTRYINTFIESNKSYKRSKKELEDALERAQGKNGFVIHYLIKAKTRDNIQDFHAYVNDKGNARIFQEEDVSLGYSVAEWMDIFTCVDLYLRDAETQIKLYNAIAS